MQLAFVLIYLCVYTIFISFLIYHQIQYSRAVDEMEKIVKERDTFIESIPFSVTSDKYSYMDIVCS